MVFFSLKIQTAVYMSIPQKNARISASGRVCASFASQMAEHFSTTLLTPLEIRKPQPQAPTAFPIRAIRRLSQSEFLWDSTINPTLPVNRFSPIQQTVRRATEKKNAPIALSSQERKTAPPIPTAPPARIALMKEALSKALLPHRS